MPEVSRHAHVDAALRLLRSNAIVAILGARQVGKSTLARQIVSRTKRACHWYDLEDPVDLRRLADPGVELRSLRGLVVLDEIHRLPELFPLLRVLADRPRTPARFLILGSASLDLLKQGAETLAGRIAFHFLEGFDLAETPEVDRLWLRGGFPRSYLARSETESRKWRDDFVRTFLERDVPELGARVAGVTMRRFWTMLAHYHGQVWNASEFARALGVAQTSIRRYLDLLCSLLVVRQLQPWHENLKKRQVRSPKVFVTDSGLLHALLELTTRRELVGHVKVGASWEGFVIGQVLRALRIEPENAYHWSTHAGAELDLFVLHRGKRLGFEVKRTEAPELTKSMRVALQSLRLDRLDVVHAGEHSYSLGDRCRAVSIRELIEGAG